VSNGVPSIAEASRVSRVLHGGKARAVDDRLLPPRSRAALPRLSAAVEARATLSRRAQSPLARVGP
jgi:hypothetical protein